MAPRCAVHRSASYAAVDEHLAQLGLGEPPRLGVGHARIELPTASYRSQTIKDSRARSGGRWGAAESEMLTHSVGLERVLAQPGESDVGAFTRQSA
jgi:hypothetical protein